ncbi:hypothetical protein [Leekyejoonella antrihumi]|uniref:Uncharacterized protein n=1 Tax=Leekyejoonella antrihumi TaxID=1660198 RepID=A0A563DQK0_9MICO|nr:hypothetical protein [Leekyejoonella antrihumi]TWP32449.1 hypothetical protein FGL98_24220 [Leekyejoonella antrihumi]
MASELQRPHVHKFAESCSTRRPEMNRLQKSFYTVDEVVNHQVRPPWLALQSLDIVFRGHSLAAVEYQGVQHSSPVDFFGGRRRSKISSYGMRSSVPCARRTACT